MMFCIVKFRYIVCSCSSKYTNAGSLSSMTPGIRRIIPILRIDDECGDVLVVSYFIFERKESRIRAIQYPSPQTLQHAVTELQQQCALAHYSWESGTNLAQVATIR